VSEPFWFEVKRERDGWSVSLPHQCERWMIAGQNAGMSYAKGVAHEDAVFELEAFLAEGRRALEALRECREVRP
jgi:hypothetical protein